MPITRQDRYGMIFRRIFEISKRMNGKGFFSSILVAIILIGCSTSGPGIFARKSAHELYSQKITDAGLATTAMGSAWLAAAESSLNQPLAVTVPYRETGYFESERPMAVGLRFPAKKGEKLQIQLDRKPATGLVFVDFWDSPANDKPRLLQSGDTTNAAMEYEIKRDGTYLLRIQPELLQAIEYTIHISSGPSLAYPIKAPGSNHIKSFWGADRDGGARRHEGIDLFAARHTPIIASADGFITRVNVNNLGGKVVWLRPAGKDYTLYYAHLDSQLVSDGQRVKAGDTIGLMGNTGNARTTAPHLHFGIYGAGGAMDPLPFVNPVVRRAPEVDVSANLLTTYVRTTRKAKILPSPDAGAAGGMELPASTIMRAYAATRGWYKVTLPNGLTGYVAASSVVSADKPLRNRTIEAETRLLDSPDSLASARKLLAGGTAVKVLGTFADFQFVSDDNQAGWIGLE